MAISDAELEALQEIATTLLMHRDVELDLAVAAGELEEICNGSVD